MSTEDLFVKEKELKVIEEEPAEEKPKEVKEVKFEEPVLLNKKGKPRAKNKDGTYRKVKQMSEEQKRKNLEALARGREKARLTRKMRGAITRAKKKEKDEAFEKEYLETIGKSKKTNELDDMKKEMENLKKLLDEERSKTKTRVEATKVEASVDTKVEPVVESVPVKVEKPTPVVVEKVPDIMPIVPPVRIKSLRAKSVWSQFV